MITIRTAEDARARAARLARELAHILVRRYQDRRNGLSRLRRVIKE